MAAIENLCHRALVLASGKCVCDADVRSAVSRYLALSQSQSAGDSRVADDHREGTGVIRFQEARFFDDTTGDQLNELRAGQRIRFQLTYQVVDRRYIGKSLKVGLGFLDEFGQFKFAVNNSAVDFPLTVADPGVVEGVIHRFPLSPGMYHCFIHSSVGDTKADHIPNAIRIDVLSGDFFGTGKFPAAKRHGVYVPYTWIT
jgi:lipopolysaccharide transport system ATP-binding protein